MDLAELPLFTLADQRLAWIDRRQSLLSQNIANADTPGYKPRDLAPFAQALARSQFDVTPIRTEAAHLAGTVPPAGGSVRTLVGEQAPDGNAVSLDDQLMRVADTDGAHELVSDLYRKYLGLFRTAIGR